MGDASNILTVGSFPYNPGFNPYQKLFAGALEAAGVNVLRIPPSKWYPLSHASRQPIDLLHLDWHHDWYRGKNLATRWIKGLMFRHGLRSCKRLPVVWTAHNLTSHDSPNPQLDHRCTQELINICSGIVVMSDASESELRKEYSIDSATHVQKIHHGHYIDCYPNEVTREEARQKLGCESDEFVFLALGSLRAYKGYTNLVRAFAAIASPSDRLVIGGSASHRTYVEELRESIAEAKSRDPTLKIDLHARTIGDEEMQYFFNASDVCVLPFERILNSGSLLLAMSFGKAVIAPRLGSIPEVAHPKSYVGYHAADMNGLKDALNEARTRFCDQNVEDEILTFTRETYDWSHVGLQLRELYSRIIA